MLTRRFCLLLTLLCTGCTLLSPFRIRPTDQSITQIPQITSESVGTMPIKPAASSTETPELIKTQTSLISDCTIDPIHMGTSDEERKIRQIIDQFLLENRVASIQEFGDQAKGTRGYSSTWFVTKTPETGSYDLTFDVVFLGFYWVNNIEKITGIINNSPENMFQVVLLYSPKFELVIKGIISAQIDDRWGILPIIMKDNALDLAKNGETDLEVNLESMCKSDEWLSDHLGELANISIYLYFDNMDLINQSGLFSQPLLDLITDPSGYISIHSKHPPIISGSSIPSFLDSIMIDHPGVLLMGVSPYSE